MRLIFKEIIKNAPKIIKIHANKIIFKKYTKRIKILLDFKVVKSR